MSSSEEKTAQKKYWYYDYHNGHIAREEVGSSYSSVDRFEFYQNGEWKIDYDLSLNLSDAIMDYGGYSIWDYEELTEEEAMRRIAESDK